MLIASFPGTRDRFFPITEGDSSMKQSVRAFFIAALFVVGTMTAAFAQQIAPQAIPGDDCENSVQAVEPEQDLSGVSVVIGVVTGIDLTNNTVDLKTDAGDVELVAAPEDLKDLKEGDTLVVFMEEEKPLEQQIA